MNNIEDVEKLKAKDKVNVLMLLLLFAIIGGGVWEFIKSQTSLDKMVVVYKPLVVVEKVEVKEESLVGENKKEALSSEEVKVLVKNEVEKTDVVKDFKGYIEENNKKLRGIVLPKIRLDSIIAYEKKVEDKIDENPVEEGKIEVFDDEKGNVVLEDTKEVVLEEKAEVNDVNEAKNLTSEITIGEKEKVENLNDRVIEERNVILEDKEDLVKKDESLKEADKIKEVFENKIKNNEAVAEADEDGTIDMMKNIVNKN